MTIIELKEEIERRAGIPSDLLTGDTAEETIAQAKALLKYRQETRQNAPRTPRRAFVEWFNQTEGNTPENASETALADIENRLQPYPIVQDGGQVNIDSFPDTRPAREQFAEWFNANATENFGDF